MCKNEALLARASVVWRRVPKTPLKVEKIIAAAPQNTHRAAFSSCSGFHLYSAHPIIPH
jgi:hypothetical protein